MKVFMDQRPSDGSGTEPEFELTIHADRQDTLSIGKLEGQEIGTFSTGNPSVSLLIKHLLKNILPLIKETAAEQSDPSA
ncbi:MAG TPA: hypothetical protein O0X01_03875 [Methanocorpusculum sp.]|nr:hypothetical protein [Methanocorpusculum sp.]